MASVTVYSKIKDAVALALAGNHEVIDFDSIETRLQQESNRYGDLERPNGFVALEELNASEVQTSMGDPTATCMTERGVILAHIYTPAPESSNSARKIADTLRDALRLRNFDGVRVTSVDPADPELMNEGLWSSAGAAIYYDYDFFIDTSAAA